MSTSTSTLVSRHDAAALRPAPTDTADLAAELADRVVRVQQQYRRETGRKLSTAAAFDEVTQRALADEPVDGDAGIDRDDLAPAAVELASRGYSREAIEGALADIMRTGSAQCTPHIDSDEDRAAVEELIPAAPADAWKGPKRRGLLWGGMVAR